MPPSPRNKKFTHKQKPNHKEAKDALQKRKGNVAGFQKRVARKQQHKPESLDVYEYDENQKQKHSRSTVTLSLSKEEAIEFGSDEENDDDIEKIRKRLQSDENVILSEEDEDIDSEDAFNSSDDERYGNSNFKSHKKESKNRKTVQLEVDLRENEMESQSESDEEDTKAVKKLAALDEELSESEESSEDEEMADSDGHQSNMQVDLMLSDEEEEEPSEALEALTTFVTGLEVSNSRKRKADELDEAPIAPSRKRRIQTEQTQGGPENEFASIRKSGGKLQISDLVAPLVAEGPSSSLMSLVSVAKTLKSTKATPVSAPLPTRVQDKLDRQAAYEQTKVEVQNWEPTMKRIREAEHLSFPLQSQPLSKPTIAEMASNFKPSTNLESAVDKLLKAAELREQDIAKTEELQMQHLTVEEVAERHAELRRMRDLMFRADIKAKRIAKIKSKTYRKIQKKEKAKQAEKLKDLEEVDPEAEVMQAELQRARERATLKHKSTGKWANAMRGKAGLDVDQRREIQEMYERGEKLRKKISGINSDSEESSDGDEDDEDDGEIAAKALEAIEALAKDGEITLPHSGRKGGVMDMKFMKDAAAREQSQNLGQVDSFNEEIRKMGLSEDLLPQGPDELQEKSTGGRVSFHPGKKDDLPASTRSSETLKSSTVDTVLDSSSAIQVPSENPWLTSSKSGKRTKAKNEVLVGKHNDAATLSKNALKKRQLKSADAVSTAKEDATIEIDIDKVTIATIPGAPRSSGISKVHTVDPSYLEDDIIENERSMLEGKAERRQARQPVFEQIDLVAKAFAGDNVVAEFAAEKRREIESDAPKEVDTTLPGWGSWGGVGITKRPPKPERIKRFPGIAPSQRQDKDKDHVIISEKKDKKAEKYLVKDLPFPYTSKAQFERRLEIPLGPEWNTRATFQKGTLPRVVKKMGTVIDPLERLF